MIFSKNNSFFEILLFSEEGFLQKKNSDAVNICLDVFCRVISFVLFQMLLQTIRLLVFRYSRSLDIRNFPLPPYIKMFSFLK